MADSVTILEIGEHDAQKILDGTHIGSYGGKGVWFSNNDVWDTLWDAGYQDKTVLHTALDDEWRALIDGDRDYIVWETHSVGLKLGSKTEMQLVSVDDLVEDEDDGRDKLREWLELQVPSYDSVRYDDNYYDAIVEIDKIDGPSSRNLKNYSQIDGVTVGYIDWGGDSDTIELDITFDVDEINE